MNINIHIGINQGIININAVEFTGNTSESAGNTKEKGYEESSVVWEQQEENKGDMTPAYTPACENVDKGVADTQKENAVVVGVGDKKINAVIGEEIPVVVEGQQEENGENKKVVDVDAEGNVVLQQDIEQIAEQILEEIQEIYTPKKKDSAFLSSIYAQLYNQYGRNERTSYYANKSERMFYCGSFLAYEINGKGEKRLVKASTCHVRLCPMCMWRRSLKAFREMRIVYDYLKKETEGSKFLLLTLTQKNVKAEDLGQELDKILYGFKRLVQRKEIKKFCLGFVRSLEITYNREVNTYHPHIHLLIHTTDKLYAGRNYLSLDKYVKLWREVMGLDYDPSTDIELFKPKSKATAGKELAEVCKYAVKPNSYIYPDDEELTKRVTKVFDRDLAGRRLLSYGGSFRKARKKLLFDDEIEENDDIIIENKDVLERECYLELYRWHFGEEKYKRLLGEEREAALKCIGEKRGKNGKSK